MASPDIHPIPPFAGRVALAARPDCFSGGRYLRNQISRYNWFIISIGHAISRRAPSITATTYRSRVVVLGKLDESRTLYRN